MHVHAVLQTLYCCGQVRSRFSEGSGEGEDLGPFLRALQLLGFSKKSVDTSNSHFVIFELQKACLSGEAGSSEQLDWPSLKPCLYKKR